MKNTILFLLLIAQQSLAAQDTTRQRYVDYGLLRAQGNIAIGAPTRLAGTNMYIAGDLEYYLKQNVSIRGGCYYFMGNYNGDDILRMNHSGFLGLSYHFPTKNNFDPYAGIYPGFSISRFSGYSVQQGIIYGENSYTLSPITVNPLFSVSAGFNYYASRFFHLFTHLQYVTGKHFGDSPTFSLNELKISFGLGYMIWARRDHIGFRKPGSALPD